jgi:hypothetical protein
MKSKVREANNWNFLTSDLGIASINTGEIIARIQSDMCLEAKSREE